MGYTLNIRRFIPEEEAPPRWQEFDVELGPKQSVLDALLKAKDDQDGSIGIRCSCQAAICGSCGVRINGKPGLACNTKLDQAAAQSKGSKITVEPLGNMPVIKDLIVDMDEVHWKKIHRVTPWLVPKEEKREREHIVDAAAMLDVTQTIGCIQCGACVSDCLAMEVDPLFVGPAASAKAYRFVGDPRDADHEERLRDLGNDPHGIFDCTHCFKCVDACPKDVAPMDQIMRLRRKAIEEHDITDRNNGRSHEEAFVNIIRKKGTLDESMLMQESLAPGIKGKLDPKSILPLIQTLPTALRGIKAGKMRSLSKLIPGVHHKLKDQKEIKRIYKHAEEHRQELNLYIVGEAGEDVGEAVSREELGEAIATAEAVEDR